MTRAASELVVTLAMAETPDDIAAVKALFKAYAAFLNVDLCFQNFDEEMRTFPSFYESLFLARVDGAPAGAIGLKRLDATACEMKRLFVQSEYRGLGLGRRLCDMLIGDATARGYRVMRLDTLPRLKAALALYRELGFQETSAYYDNQEADVIYMACELR